MTDKLLPLPEPAEAIALADQLKSRFGGTVPTSQAAAMLRAYARAHLAAQQAEPVDVAAGELDPRRAYEFGQIITKYSESFNGQQWGGLCESVDRKNLAVALDHLTEAGAMLMNVSDRLLRSQPVQAEPCRPDILERLSYHALERDDLTLDECWDVLASGWAKVHGRTARQMAMQIMALLAGAPSAPQSEFLQREYEALLAKHSTPQAEPVAWTVAGDITNWAKDFSKYRTQHYVRPVYTTPTPQAVPPLGDAVMMGDEVFAGIFEDDIRPVGNAVVISFQSNEGLRSFLLWHHGITQPQQAEKGGEA